MISCKNCGSLNQEGSKFCEKCGVQQTVTNSPVKKYTVGSAIGKGCACFFGGIGVSYIILIIRAIIAIVMDQNYTYEPGVLDTILSAMQILLPLLLSFVLAPIVLVIGLIKADK